MQKIMACLERPAKLDGPDWSKEINELLHSQSDHFRACQFVIEDQYVEEAAELRLENTNHPKNAVVIFWVEHAYDLDDFYACLKPLGRHQCYAVVETSTKPFTQEVGRTPGFCHTSFLTKPNTQSRQQWLNLWLGEGAQISIQTKSNYSLVQNVTTVPLPIRSEHSEPWLLLGGIAQDYFPSEALHSMEAYYAAAGDTQKYLENERKIISSALKFVDLDNFDCVPMSQYVVKACDW